jgi:hypothetical protein
LRRRQLRLGLSKLELGDVLTGRENDLYPMGSAFSLIIFAEAPAETVRFDADNGITLLIEVGWAAERLDGDVVLFYLVGLTLKVLRADIVKHMRQTWRTAEDAGSEHCLELSPFLTQPHRGRHNYVVKSDAGWTASPKRPFSPNPTFTRKPRGFNFAFEYN